MKVRRPAQELLQDAGLTHAAVGARLGLDSSTVSNKLVGRRRWFRNEIDEFLKLLSEELGRPVTYEEVDFRDREPVGGRHGR